MAALSLVLLVRGAGGDYAEAGLVAAAYGIAVAIGAPYGGRQVDRRGARVVLRRRMIVYPMLFALVALLGELDAPLPAIAVVAAASGLTLAPVSSALRSIWPAVAGSERREHGLRARRRAAGVDLGRWAAPRRHPGRRRPVAAVAGVAVIAAVGTLVFSRIPPVREAHRPRSCTARGSARCRRSACAPSPCSLSGSASASARPRSPSPPSRTARATVRSPASPSPDSPPARSWAGCWRACGPRATSACGSSSGHSCSPG